MQEFYRREETAGSDINGSRRVSLARSEIGHLLNSLGLGRRPPEPPPQPPAEKGYLTISLPPSGGRVLGTDLSRSEFCQGSQATEARRVLQSRKRTEKGGTL